MTDTSPAPTPPSSDPRGRKILLWTLAVAMMLFAVIYQRRTGPTYPRRGEVTIGQQEFSYRLIRSEYTSKDAEVLLPEMGADITAVVYWKRYKTADEFRALPMVATEVEGKKVRVAALPRQPAAGKLEYYLILQTPEGERRIPETVEDGKHENVVIRFKDDVPAALLIAHVTFMFFSVLIGMRTGLAALVAEHSMRSLAWITFIGMTLGGMILGPFVQKYAFGEYWTGFPWGYDLTDNKMLIMWVVWLLACSTIGLRPKKKEMPGRIMVLAATLIMMVVYLVPHSLRGSELDYSKLEQGTSAKDAIGTGD